MSKTRRSGSPRCWSSPESPSRRSSGGDLRLHPAYGTIEVRELDVQSSLDSTAALGALVRSLALEAQHVPPAARDRSELLNWSSFRAGRDGIEATILDDGGLLPLREVALRTVARLRPLARESGDAEALEGVVRILERGGGAGFQRAAHGRGGVARMLRALVDETADVARERRSVLRPGLRVGPI